MKLDHRLTLACLVAAAPGLALAQAQATVKPDGQYRYALGAGASYASGNTQSSSVNVSGDGVRADAGSKWQFGGKGVYGHSEGVKTAENLLLGTQYDQDITPDWFGFGKADALRDKLANISARASLFGGVGRHVIKSDTLTFDVTAGLGYTQDRYVTETEVNDQLRTSYGRAEALLAEESNHKWSPSTSFHQKLTVFPALNRGGGYRGVFDSGLSVSMTQALALTVGYNYRYNSDPGQGLKKGDALFVTGISVKID